MRRSYTADFKLKVLKYAETHGTKAAAAEYECLERSIRQWKNLKPKLEGCKRTRRAFRGPGAKWKELESRLKIWVVEKRSKNRQVSTIMIRRQAKLLAQEMMYDDFYGGESWCFKFMRRNGLVVRSRTSVGQKLPEDYQVKISEFRTFVEDESFGMTSGNVGNMDEVPVPFDIVSGRTVEEKGKKDVLITTTGNEKSNMTVVLSVTASGEKLNPLIIFKRKTVPKVQFPPGVVVRANPKGWMEEKLMGDWVDCCWNTRLERNPDPTKSLIILDSARCHLTEVGREAMKKSSKVAVIPGGLTKLLQPLDISVNKSFKDNLRRCWENWISDSDNLQYTKGGRLKRAGYEVIASWIKMSFDSISSETIINGFRKGLQEEVDIEDLNNNFIDLSV